MSEKLAVRPSIRFHNAPRFLLSHSLFTLAFSWVATISSISHGWSQRQGMGSRKEEAIPLLLVDTLVIGEES